MQWSKLCSLIALNKENATEISAERMGLTTNLVIV